jgi:hypothetical protein
MKHTYDFDDLAEVERRPRTALENRLRMVCRRDYVAFKFFNGANMAACLAERHITGCATKELKVGAFQPEHAGKLGFYLAAVNGTMRTPLEGPSIGVLLCESRSGPIVEFALETINQPIGVSTYHVTRELPAPMREELPTVEDLQEVVNKLRSEMESLRKEVPDEE